MFGIEKRWIRELLYYFTINDTGNNAVRYKYYVEFSTSSAVFPQAACFINGRGTLASTMPNDPVFFPAV